MSPREQVARMLAIMGCATVDTLARDCRLTPTEVRKALKDLGAHCRIIGGHKAIRFDRQAGMSQKKIAASHEWKLTPWQTADHSTPAIIRREAA